MVLESLILLASYSYVDSSSFGNLLSGWEQLGLFSYILPFLLIFALIFGILTKVNIFKDNKSINAIISLVVGLMAIQFDLVPSFFETIFPMVGVGLGVILMIVILAGLFMDPESNGVNYALLIVGIIIVIVVLVQAGGELGWSSTSWLSDINWAQFGGVLLIIAAVVAVIVGTNYKKTNRAPFRVNLSRD